jgi:hypothetical protein
MTDLEQNFASFDLELSANQKIFHAAVLKVLQDIDGSPAEQTIRKRRQAAMRKVRVPKNKTGLKRKIDEKLMEEAEHEIKRLKSLF